MRKFVLPVSVLVVSTSLILMPSTGMADKKKLGGAGTTGGTIKIDPQKDCEKEKIQKCHWEGDRHVCEWVDGPNCRIY